MRLTLEGRLSCSLEVAWNAELRLAFLNETSRPFLILRPLADERGALPPEQWREGMLFRLQALLFGVFPLGVQEIWVRELDPQAPVICTEETGSIIVQWRHRASLRACGKRASIYRDEIDFQAGRLTPFLWCLAWLFYRYRLFRRASWARRVTRVTS